MSEREGRRVMALVIGMLAGALLIGWRLLVASLTQVSPDV